MARRIVSPVRGRSAKRKSLWLDFAQVFTATAAVPLGTAVLLSSLNAAALALRPFTIVRTRGTLWAASDQEAASEEVFGALAFSVVSEQAAAIGVTAVPTAVTDAGSSLHFSWTAWYAAVRFSSAIGTRTPGYTPVEFDSKAMRKVELGQDLIVTVENQSGSDAALFLFMARILVKTN